MFRFKSEENVENKTADFNGTTVRYVTFGKDGNDLLMNTEDVCRVLGISERPEGTDLALKDMDRDIGERVGVTAIADLSHLCSVMWI
jgi:hypothetical protein